MDVKPLVVGIKVECVAQYMKHLQESALQEERQMQELRDKMQDYHLYRRPEIVAAPRIDLNPQPFYTKFLNKRKNRNKRNKRK